MATRPVKQPSAGTSPLKPFPQPSVSDVGPSTPSPAKSPRLSGTPLTGTRHPTQGVVRGGPIGASSHWRPAKGGSSRRQSQPPLKWDALNIKSLHVQNGRARKDGIDVAGGVSEDIVGEGENGVDNVDDLRDETEKRWVEEPEGMEWDLRTETANHVDEDEEIAHYRKLLVRAQSASSSSLHDLHSKLHSLENKHLALELEHAKCTEKRAKANGIDGSGDEMSKMLLNGLNSGCLGRAIRSLNKKERMRLLEVSIQYIAAQIALLEKYRQSRYDVLGRLPDEVAINVLYHLDLKQILQLRLVSKRYDHLASLSGLWERMCRDLEWRDRDSVSMREPKDGWKSLYRALRRREQNWSTGTSVCLLRGHNNYVTSLSLRGNILLSGSYDETIRIWDIPPLSTISEGIPTRPLVIPAKAVSCLDFVPSENVFVAGAHDVGRVQVWKKKQSREWDVLHTLSGHLHGIRAIAINEKWLVSVGADKAIVVWDWRTGQKVVRFGQQTNICVGIQLICDTIIAVTVDAVVRVFSISSRDMLSQYRISDLGRDEKGGQNGKLKNIGVGVGGMVTWIEGQEGWLTCATKDTIIRLAWEDGIIPSSKPNSSSYSTQSPKTPIRNNFMTTALLPPSSSTPTTVSALHTTDAIKSLSTPIRQLTVSGVAPTGTRLNSAGRKSLGSQPNSLASPSPSRVSGPANSTFGFPSSTPDSVAGKSTPPQSRSGSGSASVSRSNFIPQSQSQIKENILPKLPQVQQDSRSDQWDPLRALQSSSSRDKKFDFSRPPRVIEVVDVNEIERGAIDARMERMVLSTRFAARAGAERRLFVGAPATLDNTKSSITMTQVMPVSGAWSESTSKFDLQSPGKNPMSIALDQEKIVYGCTDGTIVIVGFVGDGYTPTSTSPRNNPT